VLAQIPSLRDLLGVGLVMCGVALHRPGGEATSGAAAGQPRDTARPDL
jgi:hypothetical protein